MVCLFSWHTISFLHDINSFLSRSDKRARVLKKHSMTTQIDETNATFFTKTCQLHKKNVSL